MFSGYIWEPNLSFNCGLFQVPDISNKSIYRELFLEFLLSSVYQTIW